MFDRLPASAIMGIIVVTVEFEHSHFDPACRESPKLFTTSTSAWGDHAVLITHYVYSIMKSSLDLRFDERFTNQAWEPWSPHHRVLPSPAARSSHASLNLRCTIECTCLARNVLVGMWKFFWQEGVDSIWRDQYIQCIKLTRHYCADVLTFLIISYRYLFCYSDSSRHLILPVTNSDTPSFHTCIYMRGQPRPPLFLFYLFYFCLSFFLLLTWQWESIKRRHAQTTRRICVIP